MKRLMVFFVFIFVLDMALASVAVNNYSIKDFYSPFENITGEINLTIVGEDYNSLITSNDGDEISLGDFLIASGSSFECSPPDCSNDYSFSGGSVDKTFNIPSSGQTYVGFVINGENVVVNDLSLKISSDFGVSSKRPLDINFFESEKWMYGGFSDEFLEKNWGCYDSISGSVGPIIGSVEYCEMISVPDTGIMKVGAVVSGSDSVELDMTVYPETGTGASWSCSYDPGVDDACVVSPDVGDVFSAGDYQICVSADASVTNYNIFKEEVGDTCGFVYSSGPSGSNKDYAIFAQGVKYGDASLLNSVDFGTEDIIYAANNLISERYGGDCSGGCVLPVAFSGVYQNARVYDVDLTFTDDGELNSENKIYDLDVIPATVDFSGVADLGALGFSVSKDMKYKVSLDSKELFNEFIDILPAPIISSVLPINPPAGVPVRFYALVDYDSNGSLTYDWDFGDGTNEKTDVSYIMHTYVGLNNYTLKLKVSAGGNLTSTRSFSISTISPREAVNSSLSEFRVSLNGIIAKIAKYPSWYKDVLSDLFEVDFFTGELDRLDRKLENSFSDDDFVEIAEDLYVLDFPSTVGVENFESPYLLSNVEDVNIEPIEMISGSITGATNEVYAKPILNWQNSNVDANFVSDRFSVIANSGVKNDVLTVYSFNVKMNGDREAYFVINRPFNELYFKESVGARKEGDSTVIILDPNSEISFDFYYKSGESTTFFVSPRLSSIVVESSIDTTCNFNSVCEEDLGENYKTCRSDCKPVFGAVVYFVLSVVFVLILYTILQIWYKRRYEDFLFKDRRQLYNLLMYVTNARVRGMNDDRIAAELRSQGWSSERVNYVIKKSAGKRVGLYEIVPIEKILAFFRNRKARSRAIESRVATSSQQQIGRNINKSEFPRRL